ncbi:MAG: purine-nucleoside phosphorylase [Pirellulales bacterium]
MRQPAEIDEVEHDQSLQRASAAVRQVWNITPRVAVVLGSGLGGVADRIDVEAVLDFDELPGLATTTAPGHCGRLVCGRWAGVPVAAFQGRLHLYEGHQLSDAAAPARLAHALGAETLVVLSAAGGLHPRLRPGDVMLIEDHIDLMFAGPMAGRREETPRRRAWRRSPYDGKLGEIVATAARREGFDLARGVYVGVLGPNYETRAEYRMLRRIGGDAVGMSTVPEVVVAAEAGMRVLGLCAITNSGLPDAPQKTSAHDVLTVAEATEQRLGVLVRALVESLSGVNGHG